MGEDNVNVVFAGPFLGRHAGVVPNPVEALVDRFDDIGCTVRLVSTQRNPIVRAIDTAVHLTRWASDTDVLVVMGYTDRAFAHADLALRLAKLRDIPTILWLHSGDLVNFAAASPDWFSRVVSRADLCAAPSTYLANLAEPHARQTMIIPNAVDLDADPRRHNTTTATTHNASPRLLWMRTFHEWYRPHLAIDILAEVRLRYPDATLTMAGQDEGLLDSVVQHCHAQGQADHVRFVGFVSGQRKRQVLADHDFYLHTNLIDNAPVTVIEALGNGLVVVAADVGGVRQLVGDCAAFVSTALPSDYAATIQEIWTNPQTRAAFVRRGRELCDTFAWNNVAPIWRDAFERVRGRDRHTALAVPR